MQQRLAARGAPLGGVAFYAAPAAVPIVMGKETWRERPRLGAMHASRAPPRGRSRHDVRCPCRCSDRGAICPENCVPSAALFLDAPASF
jgi:hypothetical protein